LGLKLFKKKLKKGLKTSLLTPILTPKNKKTCKSMTYRSFCGETGSFSLVLYCPVFMCK